ncbi:hypothetical protein FOQG_19543 [Fusarium oxysporum f. sp. raphani 54005]|uniref:Uncharacterized protein n=2 Tax=Fusarium oxysporum TaxID=5507 RepID=X0B1U2_FUSOX|nr:hypothetical protein FOQG_19543 [Fusarium oxysporum f. sp. raphani 54005]EXM12441.1 hypothetical protein FOTG_19059 [Fusarium oxysporum f. sp. vasinfectum 25433]
MKGSNFITTAASPSWKGAFVDEYAFEIVNNISNTGLTWLQGPG